MIALLILVVAVLATGIAIGRVTAPVFVAPWDREPSAKAIARGRRAAKLQLASDRRRQAMPVMRDGGGL